MFINREILPTRKYIYYSSLVFLGLVLLLYVVDSADVFKIKFSPLTYINFTPNTIQNSEIILQNQLNVTTTTNITVANVEEEITSTTSAAPVPNVSSKLMPENTTPRVIVTKQNNLNYLFGLSIGETLIWMNDDELGKTLDEFVSLGVGQIRFDLSWSTVQPDNEKDYNWGRIDRLVEWSNSRHIKLLPILSYTPVWARPTNCNYSHACPPRDIRQFANFAGAATLRYASQGVHEWEIWNEPNSSIFWKPAADSDDYGRLLRVVFTEIKNIDPSAIVISGGLSPAENKNGNIAPVDFLKQIYKNGSKNYFDAVGHHPYSYPATPMEFELWSGWSQMSETSQNLRKVMIENGDESKKIWITEVGAPTDGPGLLASVEERNLIHHPDHVTEGLQAKILQDALMSYSKYDWVGPMFWYSYKDLGQSTHTGENFFGILRFDGSKKPAFDVLKKYLEPKNL